MSARLVPTRVADDLFEFAVDTPAKAQTLADLLRRKGLAEDVVAGLERVTVRFDPDRLDEIGVWLNQIVTVHAHAASKTEPIEVGIAYGGENGPDLGSVCEALELSQSAFIEAHTDPIHTVEMIGFTPGFAYISGLPEGFDIPRLNTPRARVPAGSVGISAAFTGIYALRGPGGWPLIGRTDAALFEAGREHPFLLTPGQRVRFRAV